MRHQILFHYLDKVARVGSIRKAVEELAITPSALNRRILALEGELASVTGDFLWEPSSAKSLSILLAHGHLERCSILHHAGSIPPTWAAQM